MSIDRKYESALQSQVNKRTATQVADLLTKYKNDQAALLVTVTDGMADGDFSAHDRATLVTEINNARSWLANFLNNWPAAV